MVHFFEHPSIFYAVRDKKQINNKLWGQEILSGYLYSIEPIDVEDILYTIEKWSEANLHHLSNWPAVLFSK